MKRWKFEVGDIVTVNSKGVGYNMAEYVGKEGLIKARNPGHYSVHFEHNNCTISIEADKLDFARETIEKLEQAIVRKQAELEEIFTKIEFLKETGQETFCPKQYRAYKVLLALQDEKNTTLIDKAKKIAEMIS